MKQPRANAFDTVKAVGLQLPGEALRDLLSVSRRLTLEKAGKFGGVDRPPSRHSSRSRC